MLQPGTQVQNVQLAIFGFHEQHRELKYRSSLCLFHLYAKVQELLEPR